MSIDYETDRPIKISELEEIAKRVKSFSLKPINDSKRLEIGLEKFVYDFCTDGEPIKEDYLVVELDDDNSTETARFTGYGRNDVSNIIDVIEYYCDVKFWDNWKEILINRLEADKGILVFHKTQDEKVNGEKFCIKNKLYPIFCNTSNHPNFGIDAGTTENVINDYIDDGNHHYYRFWLNNLDKMDDPSSFLESLPFEEIGIGLDSKIMDVVDLI